MVSRSTHYQRKTFLLSTLFAASITVASAAPVAVANFSFETLPPVGGLSIACGTGCAYSPAGTAIPGWTSTGTTGQLQPGNPGSTNFFNSLPNGIVVAYDDSGTISQLIGNVTAANILYTLMVDIGQRKDVSGGALGTDQLLIGATAINGTGVAPTSGNFTTFTATYTTTSADIGKAITIQLSSTGIEGDFDNVRLDATNLAPEPGSFALLGLGLAGLGLVVRRKVA
jgi:hypothetical protein